MESKKVAEILSFCLFDGVYQKLYNSLPEDSHFVEIGSYVGSSSLLMAELIRNGKKRVKFDCIDPWEFYIPSHKYKRIDDFLKDFVFEKDETCLNGAVVFQRVIQKQNLQGTINQIIGRSQDVSHTYKDSSLDGVFIDAEHTYEAIKSDIRCWLPKVKKSGIIAGHDYHEDHPGVIRAVNESFSTFEVKQYCWIVRADNQ